MSNMCIIEEAQPSKSGRSLRLKLGGKWYSTSEWEWADQVGSMVKFEIGTSDYNGSTILFANKIEKVGQASGGAAPAPIVQRSAPTAPRPQPASGNDGVAYLPMTSNVVAHAIAAGRIQSPDQIAAWAFAAFNAAKNVAEGRQETTNPGWTANNPQPAMDEFEDDIPF